MDKQQGIASELGNQPLFSIGDSRYSRELTQFINKQIDKEHTFRFLVYTNAFAFVAIFLAANGLGVNQLIGVVAWTYSVFAVMLLINLWSFLKKRLDVFGLMFAWRLGLSYLVYDFALAGILVVNACSHQSAPTVVAVVAVVMAGSMTLTVSARSIVEFLLGKTVLLVTSIGVLLAEADANVTIIFPLLVAFILMCLSSYWIFVMRLRVLNQHFQQQHVMAQLQKETSLRERLLVYVGHDLRQPINALGMLLHTLPKEDQNIIEAKECVRSSKRLISDIVQLADFDKELNAQNELVSVQSLFDSIKLEYSFAANQANCQLRFVNTELIIYNDPKLVARIIKNFVANAIAHAGGATILVGVRRRVQSIDILVIDNGLGVSDADKTTLFDEFVKGQSSGSVIGLGLGLAIAKHYAQVCGAQILFESTLGKGSLFGLSLPIKNANLN